MQNLAEETEKYLVGQISDFWRPKEYIFPVLCKDIMAVLTKLTSSRRWKMLFKNVEDKKKTYNYIHESFCQYCS